MSYLMDNKFLSTIIYGFGTSSYYSGMSTKVLNPNYLINGLPVRGVPYDSTYMPFSYVTLSGYYRNRVKAFSGFAAVGRFITSKTKRGAISYGNDVSISKFGIYYKSGATKFDFGTLRFNTPNGGTTIQNVPSVILIALQGGGGNGGKGYYRRQNWVAKECYCSGGGAGGGSGAFSSFQVDMFTSPNTETLIGYAEFTSGAVSLYNSNNEKFATMNRGGNGTDGFKASFSSGGTTITGSIPGGARGSGSVFTGSGGYDSTRKFKCATYIGGDYLTFFNGFTGGYGGLKADYWYSFATTVFKATNGGSGNPTSLSTWNLRADLSLTNFKGATRANLEQSNPSLSYTITGGGAGSFYGSGGSGNYGCGGNGGDATHSEKSNRDVDGGKGGNAAIILYW